MENQRRIAERALYAATRNTNSAATQLRKDYEASAKKDPAAKQELVEDWLPSQTWAPGTTPPCSSWTEPIRLPVSSWAPTVRGTSRQAALARTHALNVSDGLAISVI